MATEIWSWQNGTVSEDTLDAIAVGADGSIFLAGGTRGSWGTESPGNRSTEKAIAVKLDSEGTEVFRWQAPGLSDVMYSVSDSVSAAAMGPNGSGFVCRAARTLVESDNGYYYSYISTVFHLDPDGSLIWEWTVDDENNDDGYMYDDDGSTNEDEGIYLTGLTSVGDDSGDLYVVGYVITGYDEAAVAYRLSSASREIAWKWQVETTSQAYELRGVVSVDNGQAIVVVGTDLSYSPRAVKLASNGIELWEWNPGLFGSSYGSDSCIVAAAAAAAGNSSVVIACSTDSDFGGQSAGWSDFAAVMLNSTNGNEIWRWQGGSSSYDVAKAVTVAEGGPIVLAGYTRGDWATSNLGNKDFAAVTLSLDGEEISRFQGGSAKDDVFEAVAWSSNDTVVSAGHTGGSWNEANVGLQDFVAVKTLDVFLTSGPPETSGGKTSGGEESSPQATSALLPMLAIFVAVVIVACWGFMTRRSAAKRNTDNASRSDTPAAGQSGAATNKASLSATTPALSQSGDAARSSGSRYQGPHIVGHDNLPEVDNIGVNSPPAPIRVSGARAQRGLLKAGVVGGSPPAAVPVSGTGLGLSHAVQAQQSLTEAGRTGGSPPVVASRASGGDVGHSHTTQEQESLPESSGTVDRNPSAVAAGSMTYFRELSPLY